MSPGIRSFLQRWLATSLGVLVASNVVDGIHYENAGSLIVAALLLGIFNAILRPILLLFSLPLLIFSLGLFALVINGLMLYLVGKLMNSFEVTNFWAAFWGALVISIVSMFANAIFGKPEDRQRQKTTTQAPPPPPRNPPPGQGPIIDV